MKTLRFICFTGFSLFLLQSHATTYYFDDVATHGDGSFANPFSDFSLLQTTFQAGDTLLVMPGTYHINAAIRIRTDGTDTAPIVIKAFDPNDRPVINNDNPNNQIFRIQNSYQVYDGFILNGNYCEAQLISIANSTHVTIKNCIVRRTMRDGIILTEANYCEISDCEIYYCLNGDFASQIDAHGIVGRHVTYLTVRNCDIHHTSGDCFQVGSNYSPPLWDNVFIENCKFWTSHLTQNEGLFLAGEKPGENAIDTKTDYRQDFNVYRPNITITNVEAFGFRNDPPEQVYISGRAAFNIKHNVNAVISNCVLYDNEIAFRLRGPYTDNMASWGGAHATLINCIAYDNWKAVWFERTVEQAHLYNCTFDKLDTTYSVWNETSGDYISGPAVYFHYDFGGYDPDGLEVTNNVFVGSKPPEASDASNVVVQATDFRNYDLNEYYPAENGVMIDKGTDLAQVPEDISGYERPAGSYDAGAYEYRGPLAENPNPVTLLLPDFETLTTLINLAYPNPVSDRIHLKIDSSLIPHAKSFEVINTLGASVLSLSKASVILSDNAFLIDVSGLTRGIYLVRVSFDNGENPLVIRFLKI